MKKLSETTHKAHHHTEINENPEANYFQSAKGPEAGHPLCMIECATCLSLGFSYLVYPEAEALICDGSVSRYCRVCGQKTLWRRVIFAHDEVA